MNALECMQSDLPVVKCKDGRYQEMEFDEVLRFAEQKEPAAMYEAACRYKDGRDGAQTDVQKAFDLFSEILNYEKNVPALFWMGCLCRFGDLGEDREAECVSYFEAAIDLGDPDAAVELGLLYEFGDYVEQNLERAFHLYRQAYQGGQQEAAYFLGRMYYFGRGTQENEVEAFRLLKEASENGFREANRLLGSLYGYGVEGYLEVNIDLAMKYLSDVPESDEVDAWYAKGCIYASHKDTAAAREWLVKAAETGHEDAVEMLSRIPGAEEDIQKLAEDGKNPFAMLQYTSAIVGKPEKGGPQKASEIMEKAVRLFPDFIPAREKYARVLLLHGYTMFQIGSFESAVPELTKCLEQLDILRRNGVEESVIREMEPIASMYCGEAAFYLKKNQLALEMFAKTDPREFPYATVLTAMLHRRERESYKQFFAKDLEEMKRAISSDKWRSNYEKASLYSMLSLIYAYGEPGVAPNVEYAYECILKCAELDRSLAEPELRKYRKNFWGKITYRP